MHKIADLIFLTRPPLLCASSTFFFAGAISALRHTGELRASQLIPGVLPNLLVFALVVAAAFVINQIYDVESDRINRKSFLLSGGVVRRREAAAVLALLTVAAAALSLLLGPEVRYLTFIGLVLAFAYSVPPVRLKGRPVLDMVANVAGFGVVGFALGWLPFAGIGWDLWLSCTPYALAMCGIFLNTCIPDEAGDRKAGDRTSCVVFGRWAVGRLVPAFMAASAVTGVLTGEVLCVLAVIGSFPAVVAVAVEPGADNSVLASQYAARLLLLLVCIRAPLLGGLGVLTYIASRVYYRKRFGLRYPDLTGAKELDSARLRGL